MDKKNYVFHWPQYSLSLIACVLDNPQALNITVTLILRLWRNVKEYLIQFPVWFLSPSNILSLETGTSPFRQLSPFMCQDSLSFTPVASYAGSTSALRHCRQKAPLLFQRTSRIFDKISHLDFKSLPLREQNIFYNSKTSTFWKTSSSFGLSKPSQRFLNRNWDYTPSITELFPLSDQETQSHLTSHSFNLYSNFTTICGKYNIQQTRNYSMKLQNL